MKELGEAARRWGGMMAAPAMVILQDEGVDYGGDKREGKGRGGAIAECSGGCVEA
jgi:hypothetical protein